MATKRKDNRNRHIPIHDAEAHTLARTYGLDKVIIIGVDLPNKATTIARYGGNEQEKKEVDMEVDACLKALYDPHLFPEGYEVIPPVAPPPDDGD